MARNTPIKQTKTSLHGQTNLKVTLSHCFNFWPTIVSSLLGWVGPIDVILQCLSQNSFWESSELCEKSWVFYYKSDLGSIINPLHHSSRSAAKDTKEKERLCNKTMTIFAKNVSLFYNKTTLLKHLMLCTFLWSIFRLFLFLEHITLCYCEADRLVSDWGPHVNINHHPNERELIKYETQVIDHDSNYRRNHFTSFLLLVFN